MADRPITSPLSSLSPSLTPDNHPPGLTWPLIAPENRRREPVRSFKKQQDNDRAYYERDIKAKIAMQGKWQTWDQGKRWDFIEEQRSLLMIKRQKDWNMRTTASDFPDKHDEQGELRWLRDVFQQEINPGPHTVWRSAAGGEEDDYEDLATGMPIKAEEHDLDESSDEEDEQDDEEDYEVVSRGFVINTKIVGVESFGVGFTSNALGQKSSRSLMGSIAPRGIVKERRRRKTVRAWKWFDGKMIVWPPLGNTR